MLLLHRYLWIAPHLLLWLCLALFLRRGHQREYPILAGYMAVGSALFLATAATNLLVTRHLISLNSFQWTAVIGTGVLSIFEVAVVYELAETLVLSRALVGPVLRRLLRWSAGSLLLVGAVGSALLAQPGFRRAIAAFQTLDFSANLMGVGLLLVLLVFARALQISWRSLPAGIALGLAVSASTEIAAAALLSSTGDSHYLGIDSMRLVGFHICVIIWLIYIMLPDDRRSVYIGKRLNISDLEIWKEQMEKMGR